MGTFHDDRHALHGITLAVRAGESMYVGRCDDLSAERIRLVDVDVHVDGDGGRTHAEWLARAAAYGITPRHRELVLSMTDVQDFGPLSDHYQGVGKMRRAEPAPQPVATPAPTPTADAVVALTDGARAEVRRILAEDGSSAKGLRLAVAGGGCSGLVYKVELDERREGDVVQDCDGFDVLLDRKSTIYLRGVELDYRGGLEGRGFQFRNPNATNTCGCGESFSV
jgi:iron-sulfur cluster assembly protein